MRTWRFSRLLLVLVLLMLAGVSLTLLTTAYMGAENALQQEAKRAFERDQRMLNSIVESHFRNIRQYSEEVSQSESLQRALTRDDSRLLEEAMQGLMRDSYSRYIDAMVIEHEGEFDAVRNVSLLNLELPLNALSQQAPWLGHWVTVDADTGSDAQSRHYSLLRLTLPVVEPTLGEVVGRLHTFVMLNDNFWILNELQSLFGARAIALKHEGATLDALQRGESSLPEHEELKDADEVRITAAGILREHVLKVGRSDDYRVYTMLPSDSYDALRDAYITNLGYATLMVVALGIIMMVVINRLTASALGNLTRYAEQVPEGGTPKPFTGGRFEEFTRVGRAFEKMLHRIRERDRYLEEIIDHSPDLIFLKDLDHHYCLVNQQYAKVVNTTPQQLVGRPMWEVLDSDSMEHALAMDNQVLRSGEPVKYRHVLKTRSGARSFLFSKFPITDDHGKPYLIGGIATDITDTEQTVEALGLAKEVLAETRDAAIVLDEHQQVLISNSAFAEMSGFPREQAGSAMRLFLMMQPDLIDVLDQGQRLERECAFERRDGQMCNVQMTAHGVCRDDKTRYVILFREFT
ncbi:PAS domain-containing protein [Halomonas salinarum]|uniref:PAS domain-containing protein n=1 Tax=Halomonas salinarum TaxID=1158993 RepID=UPI00143ABC76|nr:PAS domain-containing protein [Halomonas salinarum]